MELLELTKRLLEECDASRNRFLKMRKLDATPNFFEEVKPYADHIHELLESWEASAIQWIEEHRPKYLRKQQIQSAAETMDKFVVESFYKETGKKRFFQSVHSVRFILSTLLRYLEEDHREENQDD
ncbi:YppE family protein [Ureibacillus sp. FSL K6-8385]|uniref:DUF1798 family protein n=1 Tax=Ureibacillus terrenus TaxID=118246 RepID=A0A540V872_9BACL|nr:YppE family protein [Ureibacillus terrenus]MED3660665.1 YppE family protein [Ureibacillus terrenus]MED3762785.1 YppE family protein [Ureibacillus terrenus]TQE92343.1 DUF1798 family protein [Ureibacillus terrenus]